MVHTHAPLPRGFFGRSVTDQMKDILSTGLGSNDPNARKETDKSSLYSVDYPTCSDHPHRGSLPLRRRSGP